MSRLRTLLAVPAVVVVGTFSMAAAGAQTSPGPTVQGALRIDHQTDWVNPPANFDLDISVSASTTSDQLVVYAFVYQAVRTRSEFALTLNNTFARQPFSTWSKPYDSLPISTVDASDKLVRLPVNDPGKDGNVFLRNPGVYPVQIQLRDRSGDVLDKLTTHLLYEPPSTGVVKLNVGWVLPFHAAPATRPDGTRRIDPAAATGLGQLTTSLTADPVTDKVPLTLAATPETVDAMANSPAAENRATVANLAATVQSGSGRELVGGPYVPVNLSGLLGAGMNAEVDAQLNRGSTTLAAELGAPPASAVWVAQDALDTTALSALAQHGVSRLVVPEQALVPVNLSLTLTQPFQLDTASGGTIKTAAADAALAGYFRDARRVLAAHRLLADLAVLWNDRPNDQRGVVVLTPRSTPPDPTMTQTILHGLATSPVLAPVTLDGLFSVPDATVFGPTGARAPMVRSLALTAAADAPPLARSRVVSLRTLIGALKTVLPAGHPLIDDVDRDLLVAEAEELSADQRNAILQGLNGRLAAQVAQFRLPSNRTITLTARQARIPITVENDAPFPAKLHLVLKSQGLVFPSSASDTQDVPLDLTHKFTTVELTVRTRTSGVFGMTVQLVAPDGTPLGATSHITIRSTAASGVGVILSVGAAVFLVVWWVRNARSGRRARRLVPADDGDS